MKTTIEIKSEFQKTVRESDIPVVVIIIANWCGTCQIMVPMLETLSENYKGQIKFVMVDVGSVEELMKNCVLDKFPILLFFKDGNLIDKNIGTMSYEVLELKIKNLLDLSIINNISKT